jgi:hypothetical protein
MKGVKRNGSENIHLPRMTIRDGSGNQLIRDQKLILKKENERVKRPPRKDQRRKRKEGPNLPTRMIAVRGTQNIIEKRMIKTKIEMKLVLVEETRMTDRKKGRKLFTEKGAEAEAEIVFPKRRGDRSKEEPDQKTKKTTTE